MGPLNGPSWRDRDDDDEPSDYEDDNDIWPGEKINEIVVAEEKVRGGWPAQPGQIPHQVSIQNMAKSHPHFCGASIIHPLILLTAAHCFDTYNVLRNLRAVTGEQNFAVWQNTEQIQNISRLIVHENWNGKTYDNDIALVVLDNPLEFNNYTKPIRIPKASSSLPRTAQVSGWGLVNRTGLAPNVLQMASISFKNRAYCNSWYKFSGLLVTDNMICAGGRRDACEGDSGGPLTCRSLSSEPFLCGIVSWGAKYCENKFSPGVYTDVSRYHEWITSHLQEILRTHPYTQTRTACGAGPHPHVTCVTCGVDGTDLKPSGNPNRPYVALFHLHADIQYRYSRTQVTSVMINPNGTNSEEVTFSVYLPNTAFISHFSMAINGTSHDAYAMEKEAATRAYNQARNGSRTAGIVEASSTRENLFTVSTNVKRNTTVTFTLTYEELLPRRGGLYEQTVHIDLEKVREARNYEIAATVSDSRNITVLRALGMSNASKIDEEIEGATVSRNGKVGTIRWSPAANRSHIPQRFVLQYDVEPEADTSLGQMIVRDGHFAHFFSASHIPTFEKHLIFVLEVSSSMDATVLSQLKEGVVHILNALERKDHFSIITFNDNVTVWGENAGYGQGYRAKKFTKSLKGNGGANLHAALMKALNLTSTIQSVTQTSSSPSSIKPIILLFSTGNVTSTSGIRNHSIIHSEITAANSDQHVPIYSLVFGPSPDFSFLQKLSLQNSGFARKFYPNSDPLPQYSEFYNAISSPLLVDLNFTYSTTNTTFMVSDVTATSFPRYFKGSDIVVVGKLVPYTAAGGNDGSQWLGCEKETANTTFGSKSKPGLLSATVHGSAKDGLRVLRSSQPIDCNCMFHTAFTSFMERLWAYLTVKEVLQEAETMTQDQSSEIRKTGCEEPRSYAQRLALKYGFVTSLTSLIVMQTNGSSGVVEWPETNVMGITAGMRTVTNYQQKGKGEETTRCRALPPQRKIPCVSRETNETTAGSNSSLNGLNIC